MSKLIQDWVTRAARRRPDARAVIGEDETLTYARLEERANRVAAALCLAGCGEGDRVGILMPKSAQAVASIIGVLKAGCVYVPLDPDGGVARTADMLRQADPRVLLAAGCDLDVVERLRSRGALAEVRVGWLDEGDGPESTEFTLADLESTLPEMSCRRVDRDDLAYILFTSGTTGAPKGVPISHGNVIPFVEWVVEYFRLDHEDRLSGHTALTFDLSVFDMFASFAAGAELHHVPKRALLHPHRVPDFIEERKLTSWFSVPSQLSYVARFDGLDGRYLESLRHVAWCGDVLPPTSLRYWREHLPRASFTNLYGPTETTVASSYYRVPDNLGEVTCDIPIGFACPDEELLLLDEELRPVPDGESGDIYIGGVGLSRGYWRDPERTAEVFLPDPRAEGGSAVIYRTGDRGRHDETGALRFLGRSDFQIKTSGYRVEPAEVENAVLQLEEISACAVVPVRVNGFNGTTIGCGYVPSNGAPVRTGELKKRLTAELPGYMIPSTWLVLDDLPVDGRGKVDRGHVQKLFGGAP